MACPHQETCPLLGLFTSKTASALWKVNYCDANHQACQRIKLAAAGRKVPYNLLPNGRLLGLQPPVDERRLG